MAEDLGFKNGKSRNAGEKLERWARKNPDLWGNDQGGGMFHNSTAFLPLKADFREITDLEEIADWWDGVADRVAVKEREAYAAVTA